jgi:hypothetical protein
MEGVICSAIRMSRPSAQPERRSGGLQRTEHIATGKSWTGFSCAVADTKFTFCL